MSYLNDLNPAQRTAATHKDGPLLIVAGAGAGKTRTVAYRIRTLIESGVLPHKIIAVTFTNKAATEMRNRVNSLLKTFDVHLDIEGPSNPFVSTFHSLGVQILRESGECIGVSRYFTILDKSDQLSLIRKCVKDSGLDPKQFQPDRIGGVISRAKADLIDRSAFAEHKVRDYFSEIVAQVWGKYEARLAAQKSLDFDDLILKVVTLFHMKPETLAYYQDRWHYIHIDEYQDTNIAQYEFARLLAEKQQNICVVGDVDQSIYSWRGANFENILNFEKDYPEATVVLLEENYRSTKTILAAAQDIISKNVLRKEKNLYTNNADGEKISLYQAFDEGDEARRVVSLVRDAQKTGTTLSDMAVLYRANFQSRVIEEAFLRANIPYQLIGTRFFERKEVKDILAYLRAAINPDDTEGFGRIANVPPRGIGDVTLEKIVAGRQQELSPAMREKVASFKAILEDIKKKASETTTSELIKFIMKRSGLEKAALDAGEDERVENMQELVTLATKFDTLSPGEGVQKLLEDAALAADQDELIVDKGVQMKEGVRLMTVHAAKGLEFKHVFVVGLEQDLFPHRRLDDSSDPEEERRLFYVAITRAQDKLHLSYATSRTIYGSRRFNMPSEFLADISSDLIEESDNALSDTRHQYDDEDTIVWGALGRK